MLDVHSCIYIHQTLHSPQCDIIGQEREVGEIKGAEGAMQKSVKEDIHKSVHAA